MKRAVAALPAEDEDAVGGDGDGAVSAASGGALARGSQRAPVECRVDEMRVVEGRALVVVRSGRGAVSAEDDVRDRGAALDGDARVRLAPRGAFAASENALALLRACDGGGGRGGEGGGRERRASGALARENAGEGARSVRGSAEGEGTRGDDA